MRSESEVIAALHHVGSLLAAKDPAIIQASVTKSEACLGIFSPESNRI